MLPDPWGRLLAPWLARRYRQLAGQTTAQLLASLTQVCARLYRPLPPLTWPDQGGGAQGLPLSHPCGLLAAAIQRPDMGRLLRRLTPLLLATSQPL